MTYLMTTAMNTPAFVPGNGARRYLRLSSYDFDHECGSWRRHRPGYVAYGSWRSNSMGNARLFAELCADHRSFLGRRDLSSRRPVDDREPLAGASPRGALPGNSYG